MGGLTRKLLCIIATLIAAATCGGCIYIPTFGLITEGNDVSGMVGNADSDKPLRVGVATKSDVIAKLGPPKPLDQYPPQPADPYKLVYHWGKVTGYGGMLIGPCGGLGCDTDYHTLVLGFDDKCVLRWFGQD